MIKNIPLSLDQSKKIQTTISTIVTEKQKQARNTTKGKKKKALNLGKRGDNDLTNYEDGDLYEGEYDDFM